MNEESSRSGDPEKTANMIKRPPANLILSCGVCTAPAPGHSHYGGRENMETHFKN